VESLHLKLAEIVSGSADFNPIVNLFMFEVFDNLYGRQIVFPVKVPQGRADFTAGKTHGLPGAGIPRKAMNRILYGKKS
jgi:hypothetical protein